MSERFDNSNINFDKKILIKLEYLTILKFVINNKTIVLINNNIK